jgi:hypothetical protein
MARDPAERTAGAAELSRQLRHWQAGPGDEDPAAPVWSQPLAWGAAAALLFGATAWALWPNPSPPAPPPLRAASPLPTLPPATAAGPALTVPAAASAPVAAPAARAAPVPRATRSSKPRPSAPPKAPPAAVAVATGSVHLAITPWGRIEIDGEPVGVTPPLTQLDLPEGPHAVTVRNGDFPVYTLDVQVSADRPATVRHRFGP